MRALSRAWLKDQIAAGNVVGRPYVGRGDWLPVELTNGDDYGWDAYAEFGRHDDWRPVLMRDMEAPDGVMVIELEDYRLRGSGGAAWTEDDGTIHLPVHSSLAYEFGIVGGR